MATEVQLEDYLGNSTLVGTIEQLRAYLAATWFVRTARTLSTRLRTAANTSALANAGRAVTDWLRQSFLYRWLTTEPDPDVIVIDLRETYTMGPVIALLDRFVPTVDRTWHGSLLHRVTERFRTSPKRQWITESRTIRLLKAALEPPEPPAEARPKPSDEQDRK